MAPVPTMPAKLIAEFTGTFLLIFTIGCNILSQTAVWAGVSIACVLMVSVFAFGGISGANFNPAVSVALGINKNLDWSDVGAYIGVQLAGAVAAGGAYFVLFGKGFALSPAKGFTANFGAPALVCELLYTFMLCFVVLNVAAVKKGCQDWFGLAIGFVIVAGAYGAGAVSGGCFNPAVATGIAVAGFSFGSLAPYIVAELVGGALAAVVFKVVRPEGGTKDEKYSMTSKLIAEFLGTFFLILTVGLNVLGSSPAAAFSIAASLMCMIYALGDVSGANFNPAVSLALLASKELEPADAGAYMGVQIVGGIAAAFVYSFIRNDSFPLGPGAGYKWWQAAVAEIMFTFVLCLVVLRAAVKGNTKTEKFFGLAIGSCVTVGGYAIGAISGGSLNPAVSFGIASSATMHHGFGSLVSAVVYTVCEFIGAGLAAGVVIATDATMEESNKKDDDSEAQKTIAN
jgi:aquaporin Z